MPRYFFHLHNNVETIDEEGLELADFGAAERVARDEARKMAAENVHSGHLCLSHSIEVTDISGKTVLLIRFGDVVTVSE